MQRYIRIHNNTASGVYVCVSVSVCACVAYSVFGVGRFEVIKQQDLCSGRFVSKVNLMKKSLFLSKKRQSQPT